MTGSDGLGATGGAASTIAGLRDRLRDLRAARAELPPHSAQGWREDLDDQIDRVRRRLAALEGDG